MRTHSALLLLVALVALAVGQYDSLDRQNDGSLIRKRPSAIHVPTAFLDRMVNLDVSQTAAPPCSGNAIEHFELNPDLPKPDFFVVGLNMPSVTEIFKIFCMCPFHL